MLASAAKLARVFECDDNKNIYGQDYHIRETETQLLHMNLTSFMQSLNEWTSRKLFCKVSCRLER